MEIKKKEVQEMMNILTAMCLEEIDGPINRVKIETLVTI